MGKNRAMLRRMDCSTLMLVNTYKHTCGCKGASCLWTGNNDDFYRLLKPSSSHETAIPHHSSNHPTFSAVRSLPSRSYVIRLKKAVSVPEMKSARERISTRRVGLQRQLRVLTECHVGAANHVSLADCLELLECMRAQCQAIPAC